MKAEDKEEDEGDEGTGDQCHCQQTSDGPHVIKSINQTLGLGKYQESHDAIFGSSSFLYN